MNPTEVADEASVRLARIAAALSYNDNKGVARIIESASSREVLEALVGSLAGLWRDAVQIAAPGPVEARTAMRSLARAAVDSGALADALSGGGPHGDRR